MSQRKDIKPSESVDTAEHSMRPIPIPILVLCAVPFASLAGEPQAFDALAIGVGRSHDAADCYRVGLKRDFASVRECGDGRWMTGYYEASVHVWERNEVVVYGAAFSPVFTCNFGSAGRGRYAYMEGGVGIAAISELEMGRRELSSHLLFEDRLGVGLRAGALDVNFRYMHCSNAGLVPPNDGIDILILTVAYKF